MKTISEILRNFGVHLRGDERLVGKCETLLVSDCNWPIWGTSVWFFERWSTWENFLRGEIESSIGESCRSPLSEKKIGEGKENKENREKIKK